MLEVISRLDLTCGICQAHATFTGSTQKLALGEARKANWAVTLTPNRARCPEHRGQRRSTSKGRIGKKAWNPN